MELINGVDRWNGPAQKPLVLALGNFDGVHRGHQSIILKAIHLARERNGSSGALIFDPHPSVLLRPDPAFALLTDIADRAGLMDSMGLAYLIVEPFTDQVAAMSQDDFVKSFLKERLDAGSIVVGKDYSFGRGAQGNAVTMERRGREMNFDVHVCPLLQHNGVQVSSSVIRSLLGKGDVKSAAALLGYYFFRQGTVIKGSGIGKRLVYPTANIQIPPRLIQPREGVYLTAVRNPLFPDLNFGLTNVGVRPTFSREPAAMETFILDFDGDLYNREIVIFFLEKIRDTVAFSSHRSLKEQIARDVINARDLIATLYGNLKNPINGLHRGQISDKILPL